MRLPAYPSMANSNRGVYYCFYLILFLFTKMYYCFITKGGLQRVEELLTCHGETCLFEGSHGNALPPP